MLDLTTCTTALLDSKVDWDLCCTECMNSSLLVHSHMLMILYKLTSCSIHDQILISIVIQDLTPHCRILLHHFVSEFPKTFQMMISRDQCPMNNYQQFLKAETNFHWIHVACQILPMLLHFYFLTS